MHPPFSSGIKTSLSHFIHNLVIGLQLVQLLTPSSQVGSHKNISNIIIFLLLEIFIDFALICLIMKILRI